MAAGAINTELLTHFRRLSRRCANCAAMGWLPGAVEATLNRLPVYPRNWVSFFLLGLINNFAYVVINSSADDLVVLFKKQNLVLSPCSIVLTLGDWPRPLVQHLLWVLRASYALLSSCPRLSTQVANTFFLLDWSYSSRILITTALFTAGIVGVAMSVYISFWFALSCIVLIGTASSLGERCAHSLRGLTERGLSVCCLAS